MLQKQKGFTLVELMIVLMIAAILAIGPACWHYSVNAWLVWAHKPAGFGWGMAILCGICLAPLSVPVALITAIAMMFL